MCGADAEVGNRNPVVVIGGGFDQRHEQGSNDLVQYRFLNCPCLFVCVQILRLLV